MEIAGRSALYRGFAPKQPRNAGSNIVADDFRASPHDPADTSMDEDGRGFRAANEGGVSRRE